MTILTPKTTLLILVLTISIGFSRTTLPDPFSISWTLINNSFALTGPIGYGFYNNIGHIFGMQQPPRNARLNFSDATLTPYPELPVASSYPCVVPLPNGDIYIIGGFPVGVTFGVPYNTVYKLAAGANTYTIMAPMHEGRLYHSCTYDAYTNRIYAIGGSTQDGNGAYSVLKTGEYYSIEHNNWTTIASRSDNNYLFSLISVGDGNIYAFNGINVQQVILQYTIANDTWTTIGTSNKANYGQISAYYAEENIVILFGGQLSSNDGCEYFNLTSKTMTPFECRLNNGTTINDETTVGAFVPSTKSFYAVSLNTATLWTATIPSPPTAVPITNVPSTSEPISEHVPSSVEPTNGPITSRTPTTKRVSEAFCVARVSIVTLLIMATTAALMV